jgi:FAD/FMN-containing dehydrogenase
MGRSYGDVCRNDGGILLATRGLDRYIAFDALKGELICEAGMLLAEVLDFTLPRGWFLPVTPGTALATVGGAIANDVHGKNHHCAGSFGCHVLELELLRSDRGQIRCAPDENSELFAASIGGLGLTGLILSARLKLRRVSGSWIRGASMRFGNIGEFFELARDANAGNEYAAAWVDCLAHGSRLGRGVMLTGDHAEDDDWPMLPRHIAMPFTPPMALINHWSLKAFNSAYFSRPSARARGRRWPYQAFLHPLDTVRNWNRIYGPRGFYQYQCVLPPATMREALAELLRRIADNGQGSFLSVLKLFGDRTSPGWLSFPRPGATLALDFPNRGGETLRLLDQLDEITREAGGALYPAKDARMSAAMFRHSFPRWQAFAAQIDPRFSSSFWRRVTGG